MRAEGYIASGNATVVSGGNWDLYKLHDIIIGSSVPYIALPGISTIVIASHCSCTSVINFYLRVVT